MIECIGCLIIFQKQPRASWYAEARHWAVILRSVRMVTTKRTGITPASTGCVLCARIRRSSDGLPHRRHASWRPIIFTWFSPSRTSFMTYGDWIPRRWPGFYLKAQQRRFLNCWMTRNTSGGKWASSVRFTPGQRRSGCIRTFTVLSQEGDCCRVGGYLRKKATFCHFGWFVTSSGESSQQF